MNLTKRSELRRIPVRGSHDWGTIRQVLDVGFLAHVGFCVEGQPFVILTLYGRDGETLYLHGSSASRMLGELETGTRACVTVTLVDGLVLARSAFHHSMNYRSVVAFGTASFPFAFGRFTKRPYELVSALVGEKRIVELNLRDPGQSAGHDIFDARLGGAGHGNRIAIATQARGQPQGCRSPRSE